MAMEDRSEITNETVVGFFRNGDDAHRAINDLLDEGFGAGQIGAAFHSSRGTAASGSTTAAGKGPPSTVSPGTIGTGSGITGAASDTTAVTPAGLATGAGTWAAGASRPLPSGNTPHHPQYLHPESEAGAGKAGSSANEPFENRSIPLGSESRPVTGEHLASGEFRSTGGLRETSEPHTRTDAGASWWEKLKHVFGGHESRAGDQRTDKTSMNFGTGEGNLGIAPTEYEYPYSGPAFENSFAGMGLPQEHSRRLARELRQGGAIVSVSATGRISEAERILERNNGVIRYEDPGVLSETGADLYSDEDERVQIFGEVQRVYPSYMGHKDVHRKAS